MSSCSGPMNLCLSIEITEPDPVDAKIKLRGEEEKFWINDSGIPFLSEKKLY